MTDLLRSSDSSTLSDGRRVDLSRCRHRYDRIVARLGTVPDRVLAVEVGSSKGLVCRLRLLFGIPRFDPLRGFEGSLGSVPDRRIARAAGVSRSTVFRRRRALGVPAFDPYF